VTYTTKINADHSLTISADTPEQIQNLIDVHGPRERRDPLFVAAAITSGRYEVTVLVTSMGDLYTWHECSGEFGADMVAPYVNRLERVTGYRMQDRDYVCVLEDHLVHTHFCDELTITNRGAYYRILESASHWNKKTPEENAADYAREDALQHLAERAAIRQMIELPSGLYKRNPDYGKGKKGRLCMTTQPQIWDALFTWWRQQYATPAQRDVLEQNDKLPAYLRISSHTQSTVFVTAQDYHPLEWFAALSANPVQS
jgi:hypothetical protein